MADVKITQLPELTTPNLSTILAAVEDPSGSPVTKKLSIEKVYGVTPSVFSASSIISYGNVSATGTISGAKLSASGSAVIGSDLVVGSGVVVGNSGTNNPGAGELWLQSQGSAPSGTSSVNKLINVSDETLLVKADGTVERISGESGVTFFIDGGDSAITSGSKLYTEAPYDCSVLDWTCSADATGSISALVQKTTYANFPSSFSTVATVTLSSAQKNTATLSGQTFTKGDIIKVYVESATTVKKVMVSLKLRKT